MAKKERFGKFVLLAEAGASGLGTEYRAAKLSAAGALERFVSLIRLRPELAANAVFVKALVEKVKAASLLQNPGLLKVLAIGRVDSAYYLAYEHYDGKSLEQVFQKCRREGVPLAPDQGLLVASRACAALEFVHARGAESGAAPHGLLTPEALVVTYEGDVRLRGLGLHAAGLAQAGGLTPAERRLLAPEVQEGGPAELRSDVFGVGALLFQAVTGHPLAGEQQPLEPERAVGEARLAASDAPLPPALGALLVRAVAADPGRRFADMSELRKAVDAALYSGTLSPASFNFAFVMHSLFREEIDREARQAADETAFDYSSLRTAGPARPAAGEPAAADTARTAIEAPASGPGQAGAVSPAPERMARRPVAAALPKAAPAAPVDPQPVVPARAPAGSPAVEPARARRRLAPIAAGVVIAAAAAGWQLLGGRGAPVAAPAATLGADAQAALARVRELEARLQQLEREKAAAETQAVDEARQRLEQQAAAKGRPVDPKALARAEDEARRQAVREQEERQQAERRRVEEEQRAAETRLAREQRPSAAPAEPPAALSPGAPPAPRPVGDAAPASPEAPREPVPPPASAPPSAAPSEVSPSAVPAPAAPSTPATRQGSLVELGEAGVVAPVVERQTPLEYPPFAFQQRIEGTVELRILVDEKGNVADVKVVQGASGGGLNQAAIDHVRRRKYRPATKDGVPVRVQLPVIVRFQLSR